MPKPRLWAMKTVPESLHTLLNSAETGGVDKMATHIRNRRLHVMLLVIAGAFAQIACAADSGQHQVVDGISVYIGVLPAEMIQGHPKEHPESQMHGGFPDDYRHHITVALFDEDTGQRITDAEVSLRLVGAGRAGPDKSLEAMTIGGSRTYGEYFRMPGAGPYRIEVTIRLPGRALPVKVIFDWGRS